ncbi:MAG: hypothetical protein Q9169_003562 [Polycauliona sp. 2 TL-2023]
MVKLNRIIDSDDEFPELSTIIAEGTRSLQKQRPSIQETSSNPNSSERHVLSISNDRKYEGKKQIPLRIAHVDSILLSLTNRKALSTNPLKGRSRHGVRESKQASVYSNVDPPRGFDDLSDHMSDFIVNDSDCGDSEENSNGPARPRLASRTPFGLQQINVPLPPRASSDERGRVWLANPSPNSLRDQRIKEGEPPLSATTRARGHPMLVEDRDDDELGEPSSTLKFSPPRLKSPSKSPPRSQVITPPASPSKLKLPSPSKRIFIPPSPHRPSIDAFWSQEVINAWNDSYTPREPARSTSSKDLDTCKEHDKDCLSPSQNRRKSPGKSPIKADKEAGDRRKAFNKKKYEFAAAFLTELDQSIVNGQIARLTEPTGGVQLVWSRKLQSTAGRAHWRREAIPSKDRDGQFSTATYRHHASIELAEKVIDEEDRLINVIAHEYCHLLNFMISNVKDKPHGKEFKAWAKKCSTAFAHRGVNVTTTHVYEISYKYLWTCSECGVEYKRHSKSIDPTRHSCGKCRGKLVQVKPASRGDGKGVSEYQKFVKRNFVRLKRERPEMSMGEIMAALGKEFREAKEPRVEKVVVQVDKGSDGGGDEDGGVALVAKELDLLALGLN